ncbi:pleiotropic drug resistance protein 3-like [Dorcoceras hygrometricum]|uniref:Pleiotropic drug resistance protein 3-like n=1 Tax=Dorcoceras hygrometricum TaxID=472368 RepID=A0A2Z7BMH7_9LAMI|nr:pleiotropic drug resistance protein 3-like [Dorcoceras hygrometricum]
MAPFAPRTRAAAAIRMKQIVLDNQSRTIRRLRTKLATERRESAATKAGVENKVSSLERELQLQKCDNHSLRNMVILYHKNIDRRISQLVEAKREHKSTQVALEASHTIISGLTEIGLRMSKKIERMKAKKQQARESHLECHQKWQARLQEDNGVPFDDEWEEDPEEDPEEEGLERNPVGEGEIVDE